MPREITTKEELQKLIPSASEVRLVKRGDSAKIKLRTEGVLYTFKTTAAEADALAKANKLQAVEY
jgi:hypothetical protein